MAKNGQGRRAWGRARVEMPVNSKRDEPGNKGADCVSLFEGINTDGPYARKNSSKGAKTRQSREHEEKTGQLQNGKNIERGLKVFP